MNREIIAICGPTAVGKTEYSIDVAIHFNGEIVSCDSMQLYRYMDIGSAKPTEEEQSMVKHHLIDCIDPTEKFTVFKYQTLAKAAIEDIFSRGKTPVIAGGTGLYLNSLLYNMDFSAPPGDVAFRKQLYNEAEENGAIYIYTKLKKQAPDVAERIHPNNIKKVVRALEALHNGETIKDFSKDPEPVTDYSVKLIGLTRNREELYDRINKRVDLLVEQGLFQEVDNLLGRGLTENDISMKGIGYKEIIGYFSGKYSREEAIELVKKNTRHYAKRQLTWFKRYKTMKWFNLSDFNSKSDCLEEMFAWLQKN